MVGRIGEGAIALTPENRQRHVLIERREERFDWVDFACRCPKCGARVERFRTRDLCNQRDTVDFRIAYHFYAECRCGAWIDFIRKPAVSVDDFDMRVEAG